MSQLQKTALAVVALLAILTAATGILAYHREDKISQVKIGLHRSVVEDLLGTGFPDESSPVCPGCPEIRTQLFYRGNPSLWYGRLEDNLVICYVDDVVCGMTRIGL